MTSSKFLDIALKTASYGYPVFPLKAGKKTPIHKGGFHIATHDVEQIREWWTRTPYANIGIPTGVASGMAALDVDPDNGGFDSCKALFSAHGGQPHTPIVRTPRGGWHIYFKHPEGLRNSASKINAGLDVRADGGYVVAVGSLVDGVEYTWVVPPEDAPIAPFPDWLLEMAMKPKSPKSLTTLGGLVSEGLRNDYLTRLAGSMRGAGFDGEAIEAALLVQNDGRCNPPLPEQEVHQVVGSAEGWEPGNALESLEKPLEAAYRRTGLLRPGDWLHTPKDPVEDLVEGLVKLQSMTMLSAPVKAGKTVYAKQMAVCVVKGWDFLGCKVKRGGVIYLAIEEPSWLVEESFKTLGVTDDDDLQILFGRPNKELATDIQLIVRAEKPLLLIIDTITRVPRSTNYETGDYMGNAQWLEYLLYLAHETGTAIMPLYHASRSGRSLERYEAHFSILGSTGISATYDQLIYIKVESDGTRTFGSEGRFEVVEPTLLAFDKETQWLCVLGDRSKLQRTEIRNAMLGAVPDDGTKVTRQAILEAVEVKSIKAASKTKNDELNGLAADGLLLKQGNSNTGYVFSKTDSSQFQTGGENSEQPEEVEPVEEEEPLWTKC